MFERGFEKPHTILHSCFLNICNNISFKAVHKGVNVYFRPFNVKRDPPADRVTQEKSKYSKHSLEHYNIILWYLNYAFYRLAIIISTERLKLRPML